MTTRSQSAALRSPVFGGALLVLVVNDHWLKGAGLLPSWLTGKLSDFAGLIVAPILLAVLARARARHSRFACWALVVGCFAAIKLFPAAARGVEHFTRWVGFGWRIWPDPTDLLALSMLPLGWRVLRSSAEPARPAQYRWWLERVVGIAAMLACVATSKDFYMMQTSVAIINMTHDDVKLQVFRPRTALDCAAVIADPEASLIADDFAFESCSTLVPLEPRPLDLDWSAQGGIEPRTPPPGSERVCDAVLLRAPGLDDTVVFWNDVPKVDIDRYDGVPEDIAHIVSVEGVGDRLYAARPDVGKAWVADFSLPEVSCEAESP